MYEDFFNLREKPFSLNPDPAFLYLSPRHRTALNVLEYGLARQAGIVVLTGEVGSGKTTLIRHFLGQIGDDATVGVITNTHPALGDLLKWIAVAFKLDFKGKESFELYQEFVEFVEAEFSAGRRTILIVDEAQHLDMETLEELRMLSNVNVGKDIMLQTVLSGQPELLDTLKHPELRQFAQRVLVDYHLGALNFAETRAYIEHRIRVAGGDPNIFTLEAIGGIYYMSGGVPRLINSISDIAMVYAFADDSRQVELQTVLAIIEDRQSGVSRLSGGRAQDVEKESLMVAVSKFLSQVPKDPDASRKRPLGATRGRG